MLSIPFRSLNVRIAALLALASLAACSSKKEELAPAEPAHRMSWTVDGAAVSTTSLQSQKNGSTISLIGTLNPGSTTSANVMMLEFPSVVGTYALGPNSAASFAAYSTSLGSTPTVYYTGINPNASSMVGTGTIVVTALTATTVTGTFAFTGINTAATASKTITNGTFNVGL